MTLANKITVLRILAIPLFVITLLNNHPFWPQIIFIVSVASDALDGAIARMRGERTALGSFLDPLADKLLLVVSYMLMTHLGWIPLWVFIVVFSRDLLTVLGWIVTYILTGNSSITPRPLGKATTVFQMAVVLAYLFHFPAGFCKGLALTMIAIAVASLFDYIWVGNRRLAHLG